MPISVFHNKTTAVQKPVTKEKEVSKAMLHKAVQRFVMLNNATGEGIWDYDIATGNTFYNKNIGILFGYTAAEMKQNKRWWEGNLHPQDKSRIINSLNNTLLKNIDTWKGQYLFRCKNGTYKPVLERIYIVRDDNGNAKRIVGTMQDVEEITTLTGQQQTHINSHNQLLIKNSIAADENERRQISNELHENINQVLATINFYIESAKNIDGNTPAASLTAAQDLIKETIKGISKVSYQLAPLTLHLLGITTLIQQRLDAMFAAKGTKGKLIVPDDIDESADYEKKLLLFRIVTMQLQNVCKHASSSSVTVKIDYKNKQLSVTITDNGKGFDASAMQFGSGFSKMQHFASAYNGSFHVSSQPGGGCCVQVIF